MTQTTTRQRFLATCSDSTGISRTWAAAETIEKATEAAKTELKLYREKKFQVDDLLNAQATYILKVFEIINDGKDLNPIALHLETIPLETEE